MKEIMTKLASYIIALTCTLITTVNLEAATLTVGSNAGSPGEKDIPIPIDLSSTPSEEVAGFNFDLKFDTSRLSFQEVTIGPKAKEASKSLTYIQRSSNVIRTIVVGFNQNIIENGTVLNFTFDILDSAPNGEAELIIIDPSISDPAGKLLSVTTENGEIIVEGSSTDSTTTTSTNTSTTAISSTSTTVNPLPDSTTTTSASAVSRKRGTSLNNPIT